MKKPNRKEFDFNDLFDAGRFATQMIRYVDYLESKINKLENPLEIPYQEETNLKEFIDDCISCGKCVENTLQLSKEETLKIEKIIDSNGDQKARKKLIKLLQILSKKRL